MRRNKHSPAQTPAINTQHKQDVHKSVWLHHIVNDEVARNTPCFVSSNENSIKDDDCRLVSWEAGLDIDVHTRAVWEENELKQ